MRRSPAGYSSIHGGSGSHSVNPAATPPCQRHQPSTSVDAITEEQRNSSQMAVSALENAGPTCDSRKPSVSFKSSEIPRSIGGKVFHSLSTLSLTSCNEPWKQKQGRSNAEAFGSRLHSSRSSTKSVPSQQMHGRIRQCRSQPELEQELLVLSGPRWPAGMHVAISRVKHIPNIPLEPEPFYKPTFQEMKPPVFGEKKGLVVYKYKPKPSYCFTSTLLGTTATRRAEDRVDFSKGVDEASLSFEARFEGGNLEKAIRVSPYSYELYLRGDLYCHCHVHWFYFQVRNVKAGLKYRFSIVNFRKSFSLYNNGLRPLMYSEKKASEENVGWHRVGDDISFYKNNVRLTDSTSYYSLTFTLQFPYDDDVVYFAHCYPYTYSDLMDYLQDLIKDTSKTPFCRVRTLCQSLTGNTVPVISVDTDSCFAEERKKKVVVTARVHPGESNSSWILKGFVDFLTGSSTTAKMLRSTYSFEIVPMLNPDGVIVGNSRCSLSGRDLNRQYFSGLQNVFPTVWNTKQMILKLLRDEYEIDLFCDIHGHGCKQNMFLYGCSENPDESKTHLFCTLLEKYAPELFNILSCHNRMEARKEGAARIVMWRLGIKNSFTLESSLCGSTLGDKAGYHFSTADYEDMGRHLCEALLEFSKRAPEKDNPCISSTSKTYSFAQFSLMYACTDDTSDDTGEDVSQHSSHSRRESRKNTQETKKRSNSAVRPKKPSTSTFKKGQAFKTPVSPKRD